MKAQSTLPLPCRNFQNDLFFTTKRDIGGIGLGLPISSKIVAEHGGKLTFEQGINRGTVVTLSIPLDQDTILIEKQSLSGDLFS